MTAWVKRHTKGITIGVLLGAAPLLFAGVRQIIKVNVAVNETLPDAIEVLNDVDRAVIRLETENDGFREDIADIKEDYERIQDLEVMVRALYIHITGDEPPVRGE